MPKSPAVAVLTSTDPCHPSLIYRKANCYMIRFPAISSPPLVRLILLIHPRHLKSLHTTMSDDFSQVPFDKASAKPFSVSFPDADITALKKLVELTPRGIPTWESTHGNIDRRFGLTLDWINQATTAWLEDFSWRSQEEHINTFPNFEVQLHDAQCGDFTIHFAALFSRKADAVPVLMMHGWPGSFLEFLPLLSLLREKYSPDTLPYHIIVPSLPGYCFSSGPPPEVNFILADCARIMNQLMLSLGFTRYVAQGGDIGSLVAGELVAYDECIAMHGKCSFTLGHSRFLHQCIINNHQ